jgi:hypothetical protein
MLVRTGRVRRIWEVGFCGHVELRMMRSPSCFLSLRRRDRAQRPLSPSTTTSNGGNRHTGGPRRRASSSSSPRLRRSRLYWTLTSGPTTHIPAALKSLGAIAVVLASGSNLRRAPHGRMRMPSTLSLLQRQDDQYAYHGRHDQKGILYARSFAVRPIHRCCQARTRRGSGRPFPKPVRPSRTYSREGTLIGGGTQPRSVPRLLSRALAHRGPPGLPSHATAPVRLRCHACASTSGA